MMLVTTSRLWLYDGDTFTILVTESLCWQVFSQIDDLFNVKDRSPTSQSCHQHKPSPKSVTDMSKSPIICHQSSIPLLKILISYYFCRKNIPPYLQYRPKYQQNYPFWSCYCFLKSSKKICWTEFLFFWLFCLFFEWRGQAFFICSDLEVCLLDRGDWLFLWRTLTV